MNWKAPQGIGFTAPALDSSGREGADYIRSSLLEEFFRAAPCAFDPHRQRGFFSLACF
jgi:hypothetical protein